MEPLAIIKSTRLKLCEDIREDWIIFNASIYPTASPHLEEDRTEVLTVSRVLFVASEETSSSQQAILRDATEMYTREPSAKERL